jgi:hypothetical protein
MMRQKGKITIVLMMTVGFLSSLFAFFPRPKEVRIDRMAHWAFTPAVRVCSVSPLPVHDVANAIRWWQNLGYEFDIIYSSDCIKINKFGTITITLDQGQLFMNNLLGSTTLYADSDTNEIYWATIELRHPYTERVLEHEVGHALGWLHTRTRGHMMHPLHFEGGWDDDVL